MNAPKNGTAKLILPEWDPLPTKHLHASLDMISLLHLDGLYNTYVRPYFDPVPETDDEGAGGSNKRPRKKQGLSKGYVSLLEDCLDPVPQGNQAEHSLLPLVGEWLEPQRPPWVPQEVAQGPLAILAPEAFGSARLEAGAIKMEGYSAGEKLGAKKALQKRQEKRARMSQSVAPDLPDLSSSPAPAGLNPPPPKPRTPFSVPRKPGPGGRPWPRASAPPGQGGFRPGTPGTPTARPGGPGGRAPGTPTMLKRPGEGGYPNPAKRRALGTGSRSASPMGAGSSGAADDVGVKAVFKR